MLTERCKNRDTRGVERLCCDFRKALLLHQALNKYRPLFVPLITVLQNDTNLGTFVSKICLFQCKIFEKKIVQVLFEFLFSYKSRVHSAKAAIENWYSINGCAKKIYENQNQAKGLSFPYLQVLNFNVPRTSAYRTALSETNERYLCRFTIV